MALFGIGECSHTHTRKHTLTAAFNFNFSILLLLSHSLTHTLTLSYPLSSFWVFGKETLTAATDRGAGVLTPGSGSLPIKTHRTKNIPPYWPRRQTWITLTRMETSRLPASLSRPSCCSTQPSFKSIYMSCNSPASSGSSCLVTKM